MQFGVKMRAPGECVGLGEGGGRHDVKRFAEVGRVFAEVHERAVEREVGFVLGQRDGRGLAREGGRCSLQSSNVGG